MPFDGPGYGMWGGGVFGMLAMVVIWVGLVVVAISLFRAGSARAASGATSVRHAPRGTEPDDPEQILARRYAAGEIDEEEFHRRLDHLRSRDPKTESEGTWRP